MEVDRYGISKKTGLDWQDRRLIVRPISQTKARLTELCQVGRGCRQECDLSPSSF